MAFVDPTPLFKHVIRFRLTWIRVAVGIDIGADVGEEVSAVAGFRDGRFETLELATVVVEDFAVTGEVVLFEGGGGEGCFGVEEAGELSDKGVALVIDR